MGIEKNLPLYIAVAQKGGTVVIDEGHTNAYNYLYLNLLQAGATKIFIKCIPGESRKEAEKNFSTIKRLAEDADINMDISIFYAKDEKGGVREDVFNASILSSKR